MKLQWFAKGGPGTGRSGGKGPTTDEIKEFTVGRIGFQELLIILVIILLLFGSTKLPALGKSLGEAIKNFKKGIKEGQEENGKDDAKKGE